MKPLDRFIRNRRIDRAARVIPWGSRVFDIGCHDGELFKVLGPALSDGVGLDPYLSAEVLAATFRLYPGLFPQDAPRDSGVFDVVCALAVLEHVPAEHRRAFAVGIGRLLRDGGAAVLTVPSPLVDVILMVLMRLRLLHGMDAEQHHGFELKEVLPLFELAGFRLERHDRFQLRLNNLYVFRKEIASPRSFTLVRELKAAYPRKCPPGAGF